MGAGGDGLTGSGMGRTQGSGTLRDYTDEDLGIEPRRRVGLILEYFHLGFEPGSVEWEIVAEARIRVQPYKRKNRK